MAHGSLMRPCVLHLSKGKQSAGQAVYTCLFCKSFRIYHQYAQVDLLCLWCSCITPLMQCAVQVGVGIAGHMHGLGVPWGGSIPQKFSPWRHAPVGWLWPPSATCSSALSLPRPSLPCSAPFRSHPNTPLSTPISCQSQSQIPPPSPPPSAQSLPVPSFVPVHSHSAFHSLFPPYPHAVPLRSSPRHM